MAPLSTCRPQGHIPDDSGCRSDWHQRISHNNTESNCVAADGPLHVLESNVYLFDPGRSTGLSIDIFVRGMDVALTHTGALMIEK